MINDIEETIKKPKPQIYANKGAGTPFNVLITTVTKESNIAAKIPANIAIEQSIIDYSDINQSALLLFQE